MINYEMERRQIAIAMACKLISSKSNPKKLAELAIQTATELQKRLLETNSCQHTGKVVSARDGMKCFECGVLL